MSLGTRKELTPDELEEIEFADRIEAMIEAGEDGWLDEVQKYMNEGVDIDDIPIDEYMVQGIEDELGL